MHSPGQPRNPLTWGRLLRDGVTLAVLLVLLRLIDPTVNARTLLTVAGVWIAGWGFWAWRDHRAWRRARTGGDGRD